MIKNSFDAKAVGAIRYIGLKAIQAAKGGHVGMTISAAPITYTLFTKFIKINPNDSKWINRDRFVLSGGHGSMSLYPIFYLAGILDQKDIEAFKTENSKTPGHPEYENKSSNFIDASTGPLGQGFAMAVGMALAQKHLEQKTKDDFPNLFDNYTYVVCGDGDLQEGISYEAMALAGKYKLSKLIVLHDSNKYQLDSAVSDVSVENLKQRFESNDWHYQKCSNEPSDIETCIKNAQMSQKPSFIEVETIIAEGLKNSNSNKGHHGVVNDEDIQQFLNYYNLSFKDWEIDQDIIRHFENSVVQRGLKAHRNWTTYLTTYQTNDKFRPFMSIINDKFDYEWLFNKTNIDKKDQATRVYLKQFLSQLDNQNPLALSLCADLASSCQVQISQKSILEGGQSVPVGIREFAMGALINGITLYGCGFRAIGGTFLVFADYIKSAIRLGALMKIPALYAFSHDSYLVGGDGPTHQPYDQLPMLRAIENVNVYRPADEEELRLSMIESYKSKDETSILVLSRQNIKSINQKISSNDFAKGAYIIKDAKNPRYVLAASGAEVQLALEVAQELKDARVVSVPCLDKAINMDANELKQLFKAKKALITIEPSSDYKWFRLHLANQTNYHLGAFSFGKSMDGEKLYSNKGFNKETILKMLK